MRHVVAAPPCPTGCLHIPEPGRHDSLRAMRHVTPAFSLLAAALIASACSGGDVCLTSVDTACAPLYTPTFDQIFARTLQPTCAQAGASCHASAGGMGGLVFEDADAAYALLLGRTD